MRKTLKRKEEDSQRCVILSAENRVKTFSWKPWFPPLHQVFLQAGGFRADFAPWLFLYVAVQSGLRRGGQRKFFCLFAAVRAAPTEAHTLTHIGPSGTEDGEGEGELQDAELNECGEGEESVKERGLKGNLDEEIDEKKLDAEFFA
uniref:Uncharacterized protein n=1 Tax=Chromera velia CCMP2878 TaxID=1169474 RepID=A0A0G4GLQ2_9ALVE|eukprot:Cvel_4881.t1-p1 / transcript=Cvel_4881.t1 / gene=Cvel_4881 / organism=Chromera_velia_CCMP2878 / gene_product=hypothetical protein / transcript_product=hypothetical protein / location=Cvel_scaffold220:45793-46675(+) / protein_length=145 / sequence_SO=supercontig / SO=protein_coding / is_pseudo=false